MATHRYDLLLGCNLGNRQHQMAGALEQLSALGKILMASSLYETEPWGYPDQPWFLNQAVILQTNSDPVDMFHQCKSIEKHLGRLPGEKWHARHMDIDILFCDDLICETAALTIPHPRLQDRNFVLIPLLEIEPEKIHPVLGKSIEELYADCRDTGEVYIFSADE